MWTKIQFNSNMLYPWLKTQLIMNNTRSHIAINLLKAFHMFIQSIWGSPKLFLPCSHNQCTQLTTNVATPTFLSPMLLPPHSCHQCCYSHIPVTNVATPTFLSPMSLPRHSCHQCPYHHVPVTNVLIEPTVDKKKMLQLQSPVDQGSYQTSNTSLQYSDPHFCIKLQLSHSSVP